MKRLAIVAILASCASAPAPAPDLPPEVLEADGVGGATAKVDIPRAIMRAILKLIGNTRIDIRVVHDPEKQKIEKLPNDK